MFLQLEVEVLSFSFFFKEILLEKGKMLASRARKDRNFLSQDNIHFLSFIYQNLQMLSIGSSLKLCRLVQS